MKYIKRIIRELSAVMLAVAVMAFVASCKDDADKHPELSVTPSVADIVFSSDGATLTSGGAEISQVFTISTNQSTWDISANHDWLRVYKYMGNRFMVSAQTSLAAPPEEAEITITAGNAMPVKIRVQQFGADPTLIVTPEQRTLVFSTNGRTVTSNGYPIDPIFAVATNETMWDAVSDRTWLTVTKDEEDNTFTLTAARNTIATPHEAATVTVTGIEATPVYISVTQELNPSENITDQVLKNTKYPFVRGTLCTHHTGNVIYRAEDWLYNEVVDANGSFFDMSLYGGEEYNLCLYADSYSCPYPNYQNGKLYQTVELDAGTYRFDVYFDEKNADYNPTPNPSKVYIVAALGDNLPDESDFHDQAIIFLEANIFNGSTPVSIEFVLTEKSTVSLGFVANLFDACLVVFSKIELWEIY